MKSEVKGTATSKRLGNTGLHNFHPPLYCRIQSVVSLRGGIQNIADWCSHVYSSFGSAKHRSHSDQTVNSGFYCDFFGECVEKCEDVASNFGENRPGFFTMTTPRLTLPSSPSWFWRNTKWVSSPHPLHSPDLAPCDLFLFKEIKLKLKGRRFDTIEESQAESQRVLDTGKRKGILRSFPRWWRRWGRCLHPGGNYFEGDVGRLAIW
jgi:hypothetical protein